MSKFNKLVRLLVNNEHGSIIVLVAISMVVILGMAAIVIDAGSLYLEKSKIQKAVDAAALAGAQDLPSDPAQAKVEAINTAKANGVEDAIVEIKDANREIKVTKSIDKDLFFARVLGFTTAEVAASGTVRLDPLASAQTASLLPMGINQTKYPNFLDDPENLTLKWTHHESEYGNWGYLDFKHLNEVNATYTYSTDPGNAINILKDLEVGDQFLVPIYRNLPTGFEFDETTNKCSSQKTDPTGAHCIQVIGFATVKIEEVITTTGNERSVRASLIEVVGVNSSSPGSTSGENFETYEKFKLVE